MRRQAVYFSLFAGLATGISAQEGGVGVFLDVSQSLSLATNPDNQSGNDESGFQAVTALTLSGFSETRTQALRFSIGSTLDYAPGFSGRDDLKFGDLIGSLGYQIESRDSLVAVEADYRRADVGSFVPLTFIDGTEFLIFDSGTRADTGLSFDLEFGRTASVGAAFSADYTDINYTDTIDPELVDRVLQSAEATVFLRFDPVTTARVGFSRSTSDSDLSERQTDEFSVGIDRALSPRLDGSLSLTYTETELASGSGDSRSDGFGLDLSLTGDLPDGGGWSASLASAPTTAGQRTELQFGRGISLRGTDVSIGLGFVTYEGQGTEPTYDFQLAHELKRGALTVSLSESTQLDDADDRIRNRSLQVGLSTDLTSQSSFEATITVADRKNLDQAAADSRRYDLTATYAHAVTRDWDLRTGVTLSRSESDTSGESTSNSVFVSLDRQFQLR